MTNVSYLLILYVLMAINTVAGTSYANVTEVFDKEVLKKGLWKAFGIALCFAGLTLTSYIAPQIMIMEMNVMDIIPFILLAGIVLYGRKVVDIMTTLIGVSISGEK